MSTKKPSAEEQELLDMKTLIYNHLKTLSPETPEFKETQCRYNEACATLAEMRTKPNRIEPWLPFLGHMGGIGLMSFVEMKGHTFATKAFGLVKPMK